MTTCKENVGSVEGTAVESVVARFGGSYRPRSQVVGGLGRRS